VAVGRTMRGLVIRAVEPALERERRQGIDEFV
jgi:hypothetical protein